MGHYSFETGPGKTSLICTRTEIYSVARYCHTHLLSLCTDRTEIYGQVCFYWRLISGLVKHIQATAEARGLLAGVYKAEWVCITAQRCLVRLVLWSRVLVSTFPRHSWAKCVYWLLELTSYPLHSSSPSTPLYAPLLILPEFKKTVQKPANLTMASDYNNVQWKVMNCCVCIVQASGGYYKAWVSYNGLTI